MPIDFKEESKTVQKDSGRSQKGHSGDKYSDETPKKDYADYKKDDTVKAREESIKIRKTGNEHFIGGKSLEARKQELISHIQNLREDFGNADMKAWKAKFAELYGLVA